MNTALKVTIALFLGIAPLLRGLGTTRDCDARGVGFEGLLGLGLLLGQVLLDLLLELLAGREGEGLLHVLVVLVVHLGPGLKLESRRADCR